MCWKNANKARSATERQTDKQTDSQQHNKDVVGNENKGPVRVEAAQIPPLPSFPQPELGCTSGYLPQ